MSIVDANTRQIMKPLKPLPIKKAPKQEREKKILIGLVAYYLKSGKAVGSDTLKEAGFDDVSSATIRNYFVRLEEEGYLHQAHTSGGRVPTDKAFRFYADHILDDLNDSKRVKTSTPKRVPQFDEELAEIKEVVLYLQQITESVSQLSGLATFISSPRFDQDFVVDIKLVSFDQGRYLSALMTNFGLIHTELLHSPKKLSAHSLRRLEAYFRSRLRSGELLAEELDSDELEIAHRFYQESMARYLVSYSNFTEEDIYTTGMSKLLRYPEFQDATSLTSSLSLFENHTALRLLIRECIKAGKIKYWIGSDLFSHLSSPLNCAVVSAPYSIGTRVVGALGLLGPMRMPYADLFSLLDEACEAISKNLTRSLYKYKITFRTPAAHVKEFETQKRLLLPQKG